MNRQIRVGDSKYDTFDDKFYPLVPISFKSPNFALEIVVFFARNTLLPSSYRPMHIVLNFFYTTWVRGVAYQNFQGQNQWGFELGEHVKCGTPYLFLQPLKLATSNLVYNLGLRSSLPRNNFSDKNWRGYGLGSIEKN